MNIHFIAIGGAAMHNLAIALKQKGYNVSGSDDEIFEPSASRLKKHNLFPEKDGWYPEKINSSLDAVILGMHARADNPELLKAQQLGVKIFSYPEYLYEQSKDKTRIVIGGSHGKTTITAMIMHVLKSCRMEFDFMVGSQLEGFETMTKLTAEAPCIILEGDEYLSSPVDRRPKFHLYHPHIALISGIAWDHINVFPTFENYIEQFRIFIDKIEEGGTLIWCGNDDELKKIVLESKRKIKKLEYRVPEYEIKDGTTYLTNNFLSDKTKIKLQIFGEHNLMNAEGARLVCNLLGISDEQFCDSISTFSGAAKRLELIGKNEHTAFYKDFAHSPSKLKATTEAVKKQFPDRKLIAFMELHTFSSLNQNFLLEYNGSMNLADEAIIYFNPKTIEHKKLNPITVEEIKNSFGGENISVITDSSLIEERIKLSDWKNKNLLMMSSGTFDGLDLKALSAFVLKVD